MPSHTLKTRLSERHYRSDGRFDATGVKQVLMDDRNPMQRPAAFASFQRSSLLIRQLY
jgi:hypothetical protein